MIRMECASFRIDMEEMDAVDDENICNVLASSHKGIKLLR